MVLGKNYDQLELKDDILYRHIQVNDQSVQ